jgi:signal transduction histidine kinase
MSKPENQTDAPSECHSTQARMVANLSEEELRDLVAKYEQKLDDVADLITKVRHEINNPLTGVLGQAQLLLREDLSDKARKRVETIEEQALRITNIVAELRQVQKNPKA